MKTSHWFAELPQDHCKIGISRGVPRGLKPGYRVFKTLAPGEWFNSVPPREYDRLYAEILGALDPRVIVAKLHELADGRIPVMVCFEKPNTGTWCHRAMTAKWIHEATGNQVPEFGFEHLGQHEHPLMPEELRRAVPPPEEANDDVTPFIGRKAMFQGRIHTVLRPDPDNPGQAIIGNSVREFSTTLQNLQRYFTE